MITDFRLSACWDGEGLTLTPQRGYGRLCIQALIDGIQNGRGRSHFSHPQQHVLDDHFSTSAGLGHHVELRFSPIESQTNVYSIGDEFHLLK